MLIYYVLMAPSSTSTREGESSALLQHPILPLVLSFMAELGEVEARDCRR
jgi:hypothetical protein